MLNLPIELIQTIAQLSKPSVCVSFLQTSTLVYNHLIQFVNEMKEGKHREVFVYYEKDDLVFRCIISNNKIIQVLCVYTNTPHSTELHIEMNSILCSIELIDTYYLIEDFDTAYDYVIGKKVSLYKKSTKNMTTLINNPQVLVNKIPAIQYWDEKHENFYYLSHDSNKIYFTELNSTNTNCFDTIHKRTGYYEPGRKAVYVIVD